MPQDYEFEVTITARVRVRAESEAAARDVVSSVLASPGTEEISIANQANFVTGKAATVQAVDFAVKEDSLKLLSAHSE
jgi:hypothetical protein